MAGCEMRRFTLDAPPDLTGCDAVIHLAGESVVGIWTAAKKRAIVESRVQGTRRIVEAMAAMATPPEVFVSGSAVGFYSSSGDAEITETSPPGAGFLSETVQAWEAETKAAPVQTRVILLRTGIVLSREGGALAAMLPAFRAGLGARIGDGRQWMPWIHIEDIAMLALFAMEDASIRGPLNATAPWPSRNADFTRSLAAALHRPAFFRAPAWAVRLIGEFSHELLDSKRVLPGSAAEHGFRFQYPELEPALKNLVG